MVGESHYQEALWRIVGGIREEHVRHDVHAVLLPEPDNEHDRNSIMVHIDGQLVGYLSRENAVVYGPGLAAIMRANPGTLVALEGVVVGGGQREDRLGYLGVFLDHDPTDFGLQSHRVGHGGELRTGLSEAITTDLEDDRYDLSWLNQLSGNDTHDIEKLRAMLATKSDPIDRHYLFSELGRRLYRSRDAFASALDEFDVVCRQHDTEMVVIRAALQEKFGQIPVIEMYRQATIRCQKARDWTTMQEWAERGLAVYASDAARPEVVADLHKRLDYAAAKLSAVDEPKPPRTSRNVTVSSSTEIETLICVECGSEFQRIRIRGRKPHRCPACHPAHATTIARAPSGTQQDQSPNAKGPPFGDPFGTSNPCFDD